MSDINSLKNVLQIYLHKYQCLLNGRYMVSWMNEWMSANDLLHQAECPEAIASHVVSTVLVLFCFPYITLLGFEQKTVMIITLRWNQKLAFYNSGLKEQNLQFELNRYQQEIPFRSSRMHILSQCTWTIPQYRSHAPPQNKS